MTGTSLDWADLEAGKIAGEDCSCFEYEHGTIECPYCHCHDDLAAALRAVFLRGRIAGLREANVFADTYLASIRGSGLKGGEPNAYESACKQIGERIRAAADKLEKGEA